MLSIRHLFISTRTITMVAAAAAVFIAMAVMLIRPVPYAMQSPGPTLNTLGEIEGHELISSDQELYPTEGELRLTTVMTSGGPGFPIYAGQALRGWASGAVTVVPSESLFAPGITQDQISDQGQQMMISSQTNATVAALEQLGYTVPAELIIVGAGQGTDAAEHVAVDDEIIALTAPDDQRWEVPSYADLLAKLRTIPGGSTVELEVIRDGNTTVLPIVTMDDGAGGSQLGIFLNPDFQYPIDISIFIENVGGPSAGLMFALGIIESLTEEDLTNGHIIAGTGTMALDGMVGPIGGVVQKMHGSARDGADYFLIPADNCAEAVGHIPSGLREIPVETLDDAQQYITAIGAGQADSLPHCPAG